MKLATVTLLTLPLFFMGTVVFGLVILALAPLAILIATPINFWNKKKSSSEPDINFAKRRLFNKAIHKKDFFITEKNSDSEKQLFL